MRMKPWIPIKTLCTETKKTLPSVFHFSYWKLFYMTLTYGT